MVANVKSQSHHGCLNLCSDVYDGEYYEDNYGDGLVTFKQTKQAHRTN